MGRGRSGGLGFLGVIKPHIIIQLHRVVVYSTCTSNNFSVGESIAFFHLF